MILPREVQKALLKRVFTLGHFRAPVSVKAWPREDDTALCHPAVRRGSVCFLRYSHGFAASAAAPWATICRLAMRRGSQIPLASLARQISIYRLIMPMRSVYS